MAGYLIQGETLTAIADAIRSKSKATAALTPAQMAAEIAGLKGGSIFQSSAAGYLPVVYEGFGSSEFTVEFECSAFGTVTT